MMFTLNYTLRKFVEDINANPDYYDLDTMLVPYCCNCGKEECFKDGKCKECSHIFCDECVIQIYGAKTITNHEMTCELFAIEEYGILFRQAGSFYITYDVEETAESDVAGCLFYTTFNDNVDLNKDFWFEMTYWDSTVRKCRKRHEPARMYIEHWVSSQQFCKLKAIYDAVQLTKDEQGLKGRYSDWDIEMKIMAKLYV